MNEYNYVIFNDRGKVIKRIGEDWNLSIPKLLGSDSFISKKLNNLKPSCQIRNRYGIKITLLEYCDSQ